MQIFKVLTEGFGSNSYILTADGKTAVVIDPSGRPVLDALKRHGLVCKHVLLTHGHFDHVGACGKLQKSGAQICCGSDEKDLIFSKEYLNIFGGVDVPVFSISRTFEDGEETELCGITLKVIKTAGHTAGGVSYVIENNLFTGDTLFRGSVGRWDLPTGNYPQLLESVRRLAALNGDFKIYCGHGEDSLLSRERVHNPYLR